jgi:hypothetical protein
MWVKHTFASGLEWYTFKLLTHFAVLPEGIVLTYHPYQIDCFAAGEYHAV